MLGIAGHRNAIAGYGMQIGSCQQEFAGYGLGIAGYMEGFEGGLFKWIKGSSINSNNFEY
jgi:hypothetical protein